MSDEAQPKMTQEDKVKFYLTSARETRNAWLDFLQYGVNEKAQQEYRFEVEDLERLWPEKRSVTVDWMDLYRENEALAEALLQRPRSVLALGQKLLYEAVNRIHNNGEKIDVRLRINGLLSTESVNVRHLRHEHVGKLVCISGMVRQASEIRPKMVGAVYACAKCGHRQLIDLSEEDERIEPGECPKPDGCGSVRSQTSFTLIDERCEFIDTQDVYVQELAEGIDGGAQPERILCKLEHDLCDDAVRVNPGDRVRMIGIVMPVPLKKKNALYHELYLDVIAVEKHDDEFDSIVVTDQDINDFKHAVHDPKFLDLLSQSIAPSIKGYEIEKLAILLQLVGGGTAVLEDGTQTRGDIHILLAGDPGVAKSQMLRATKRMIPRAIYAQGGSTSKVGLTAATVRDELTSRWTLEAGALVLADGGIALIDEIDKMGDEDAVGMHEAMESQCITIAKAGLRAEMKCRCPILAAANPIHGRWDENAPFAEQLGLSPPLLSRFDLVFAPRDRPDAKKDRAIAEHIIKRRTGKIPKSAFSLEWARKFLSYARSQNKTVDYDADAADMIATYYADLRSNNGEDSIAVTPRQNEGMARLAEAVARAHLRDVVKKDDVKTALKITEAYLQQLRNEDGAIDIYKQVSDTSSTERGTIEQIAAALRAAGDSGLYLDDLVQRFPKLSLDRLEGILDKMSAKGEFYKKGDKLIAVGR